MNRLAFVGVLQRGEQITRKSGAPLPDGHRYLLTTPLGAAFVVRQDKDAITVENSGPGVASYMIFVVDEPGMRKLAAVRGMVAAFTTPKPAPKDTPR